MEQMVFIVDVVKMVSDVWKNGYCDQFVVNEGIVVGVFFSQIINGLNEYYEMIKWDKIGILAGVVIFGFINLDKVEVFYFGLLLLLA